MTTIPAQEAALTAAAAFGYFPATATVEAPNNDETDSVGAIDQVWSPIIEGAQCRFEPAGGASREVRRSDGTTAIVAYNVKFRHLWPDIDTEHRIVGDGRVWNILGVTHDASKTHTYVAVEEAG